MSCHLLHSGTTKETIQPALWLFHLVLIPGTEQCFGYSSAAFRTLKLTYTQGQASPTCGSCSSSTLGDPGKRLLSPDIINVLEPITLQPWHWKGEHSYLPKQCLCPRIFSISNMSIPRSKAHCCSDSHNKRWPWGSHQALLKAKNSPHRRRYKFSTIFKLP